MRIPVLFFCFTLSAVGQEGDLDRFFERNDRNSDGRISAEELKAAGLRSGWVSLADEDRDGSLSRSEILAFQKERDSPEEGEAAEAEESAVDLPDGAPVTSSGIRKAARYSASREGHAFLVSMDGSLAYERYERGWSRDRAHRLASGTKSFSAALLAAAVKDGLLTSLDEKVSDTLHEWNKTDSLSEVTYRELLSLTSGIEPGDNGKVPAYPEVPGIRALSAPGEAFRYGPNAFQAFGEALRRKLTAREDLAFADPLSYLENRVFDPIGLEYGQWRRDRDGMPHLPSGAFLTAREWAKYGEFLLNEGSIDGKALVDAEVLRQCLQGSAVNPVYGLGIWLLEKKDESGPAWRKGGYMAAGAGKQRLYVLPAVRMVVVRQGESRKFDDREFLNALFSG